MNELSLSAQTECSLISNRRAGTGFYGGKCVVSFLQKEKNLIFRVQHAKKLHLVQSQ